MNTSSKFSAKSGLVRKIAVLAKDYYSLNTIDDLFLFAGANPFLRANNLDTSLQTSSQRMNHVYLWVQGISENASDELGRILGGVAQQLIENNNIPEEDKQFLIREIRQQSAGGTSGFSPFQIDRVQVPKDVEQLLEILVNGLPRAMYPLKYSRRKGLSYLEFDNEYDVQSLLHSLLRPWIKDIRPEEYTPSYAGSSTRIDFLLPEYGIVCEVKYIRDKGHGKKIGDELIIDIAHYKIHPGCNQLWIVIYDPDRYILNPDGLVSDLEHQSENLSVKIFILGT